MVAKWSPGVLLKPIRQTSEVLVILNQVLFGVSNCDELWPFGSVVARVQVPEVSSL